MPIKINDETWECSICKTRYPRDTYALSCEQSHEYITIRLHREDLFKLMQFLMTKDESLLSGRLIQTLRKYMKGEYK